jgi:hypothetical protein
MLNLNNEWKLEKEKVNLTSIFTSLYLKYSCFSVITGGTKTYDMTAMLVYIAIEVNEKASVSGTYQHGVM